MYQKNYTQLTIGKNLLYQKLPDDLSAKLNRIIDWKPFETILTKLHSSDIGRLAYNPISTLKILIIQQIYDHSDPEMEIMLHGNFFYHRFLGLSATDSVPNHSTICGFRKDLQSINLYRACFQKLKCQLAAKGFELKSEKIIDACLVRVARNPGKDDHDASFSIRENQTVYGYKDHIAIDSQHEFVIEFICLPTNVHYSQVLDHLLTGNEKMVIANKAYDLKALKKKCHKKGIVYRVLARGTRNYKLSSSQRKRNAKLAAMRRKVDEVFGIFSLHLNWARARYVGLLANEVHLFSYGFHLQYFEALVVFAKEGAYSGLVFRKEGYCA